MVTFLPSFCLGDSSIRSSFSSLKPMSYSFGSNTIFLLVMSIKEAFAFPVDNSSWNRIFSFLLLSGFPTVFVKNLHSPLGLDSNRTVVPPSWTAESFRFVP